MCGTCLDKLQILLPPSSSLSRLPFSSPTSVRKLYRLLICNFIQILFNERPASTYDLDFNVEFGFAEKKSRSNGFRFLSPSAISVPSNEIDRGRDQIAKNPFGAFSQPERNEEKERRNRTCSRSTAIQVLLSPFTSAFSKISLLLLLLRRSGSSIPIVIYFCFYFGDNLRDFDSLSGSEAIRNYF